MTTEPTMTPCPCGERHPDGARYYVSVADAGRVALLAGPFTEHAAALGYVDAARQAANDLDQWSHFYAFGTVAMPAGCTVIGRMNERLGIEVSL